MPFHGSMTRLMKSETEHSPVENTAGLDALILVLLRKPNRSDPEEMRSDPFWEFGSFGLTGCHSKNLMNPKRSSELHGKRLGFVQRGNLKEIKLVLVTPPIKVQNHGSLVEALWDAEMPLTYDSAPTLINNRGNTDFPEILKHIANTNRTTFISKFTSRFRTRRRPLSQDVSAKIVETYRKVRETSGVIASTYVQALPFDPPHIDKTRELTYQCLKEKKQLSTESCSPRLV